MDRERETSRMMRRNVNLNAAGNDRNIKRLEVEWGRYKYAVLAHSERIYLAIRTLLREKTAYPVEEFYRQIDLALASPSSRNACANAATHVWGYFKELADDGERRAYRTLLSAFLDEETTIAPLKSYLGRLAVKYDQTYLKECYYFEIE